MKKKLHIPEKAETQEHSVTFKIKNAKGLHTRPSTEIVKCATRFKSQISLTYRKTTVNARSLLGILMLAAEKGAKITVTASGEDALQAAEAMAELASQQFHMKY